MGQQGQKQTQLALPASPTRSSTGGVRECNAITVEEFLDKTPQWLRKEIEKSHGRRQRNRETTRVNGEDGWVLMVEMNSKEYAKEGGDLEIRENPEANGSEP